MSGLILWGVGGHGKVVADIALAMGRYSTIAFVDDDASKAQGTFHSCRVEGTPNEIVSLIEKGYTFFHVSIGSNEARARCFVRALGLGLAPATLVHSTAVISPAAHVGQGTVVMPRVVVNSDARIGQNCIINTAAVIEHDCKLGDHVHISPGAILTGGVAVGSCAHVGAGAIVLPGVQIGEGSIVGAGAVVLRPVPAGATVVGVPAKLLRPRSSR